MPVEPSCKAAGGRTLAAQARGDEDTIQRYVPHVSPPIRPAAGVVEARAHPAQRIGVELPNALLWHLQRGQPVVDCWYHSVH